MRSSARSPPWSGCARTASTSSSRRRPRRATRPRSRGSSSGRPSRAPSASTSTSWSPPAGARGSRTSLRRGSRPSSRRSRSEESRHRGSMMVRAKCAPHFMRHVHQADPDSPVLSYRTRCPCGIDYCRITPGRKAHALPVHADRGGRPARAVVRRDLGGLARLRGPPRRRARRPLRPLRVPHGLRRLPRPRPRHERRLPRRGPLVRVRAAGGPPAGRAPGRHLRERRRRLRSPGPRPPGRGSSGSPRSCGASSCRESRSSPARGASTP